MYRGAPGAPRAQSRETAARSKNEIYLHENVNLTPNLCDERICFTIDVCIFFFFLPAIDFLIGNLASTVNVIGNSFRQTFYPICCVTGEFRFLSYTFLENRENPRRTENAIQHGFYSFRFGNFVLISQWMTAKFVYQHHFIDAVRFSILYSRWFFGFL